jgi:hypothetical protein
VGQLKRRKYKLKNHKTSEVEQLKRRRYSQRYHKTLEEGVKKKKIKRNSRTRKGGGYSNTRKKKSKIQNLDIEQQTELTGEEIKKMQSKT